MLARWRPDIISMSRLLEFTEILGQLLGEGRKVKGLSAKHCFLIVVHTIFAIFAIHIVIPAVSGHAHEKLIIALLFFCKVSFYFPSHTTPQYSRAQRCEAPLFLQRVGVFVSQLGRDTSLNELRILSNVPVSLFLRVYNVVEHCVFIVRTRFSQIRTRL